MCLVSSSPECFARAWPAARPRQASRKPIALYLTANWEPEGWRGWGEEGWAEEGWAEEGWAEEGWAEEGWAEEGGDRKSVV